MSQLDASLLAFRSQLAGFAKRTEQDARDLQVEVTIEVLTGVVFETPVDTGRARGGWLVDFAEPSGRPGYVGPYSAQAIIERETAKLKVDGFTLGVPTVVSNSVEYIGVLEDGSSAQAPEGMLAVTLQNVAQRFAS